ncbi:winged helix-turn-helix transcriptional regulator [Candidatus Kuenenbacteria bacterium]|nr:winged helix-turn-helix transcriptional regulator [Candidatus Kuenenbacteria bacterium]
MDLVEKIGSGLARINEMMDEYLLPHPIVEVSNAYFGITFVRPDLQEMSVEQRFKKYQEGEKVGEKLTENQKKIINLIRGDQKTSIVDIAQRVGIAGKNIEINLRKLKNKKIIKRVGAAKGGYWEVII